jgi:hypothetical protein
MCQQFMTGWSLTIAMKKSKFTEAQIVFALQQAEGGVTVGESLPQARHQ